MSKGSWRRPCQISREEEERRWEEAFGPRRIPTVMSDEERQEFERERERIIREQSVEENPE